MCLLRFVQTCGKNILACPTQMRLFFCGPNSKNTPNAAFTNPFQTTIQRSFHIQLESDPMWSERLIGFQSYFPFIQSATNM